MNKSLITPQTVDLVSRLTEQKLSKEDIDPPIVFLAALVTVLLGVIYADGAVSAEETQRLRTTLAELIPANNGLRQFTMLMVKGVKENQFYKNLREFLALTACFSDSEKLLLISFCYQMSAADGTIDKREKEYLKIIAKRLGIDERHSAVLEASFSSQSISNTAALDEVHLLLDPAQFQSLDSLFVRAASHISQHLPAKPKPQINQKVLVSSYQELKKFQEYRQQLNGVCDRLNQILTDGHERAVLTDDLAGKIKDTSDALNPATGLKQILNITCEQLNQKQKILEAKLTVSQQDKPKIFEKMAEVSGRDVKIRVLAKELMQESLKETLESWKEWLEGLGENLTSKSNYWTSEHSHLWSQDKLIRDYTNQYVRDISQEIEKWGNQKVESIVRQNMSVLENQVREDIYTIQQEFERFDKQKNSNLVSQFNNLAIAGNFGGIGTNGNETANSISEIGDGGLIGGLGIGAAVGAALLSFLGLGIGIIRVILGALAAGAGGGLGLGLLDGDSVKAQIKQKVCELGFEAFEESSESIFEKAKEKIITVFQERIESSNGVMREAILLWENLLEDQEKHDRQTQEECDAEKVWIENKRQELLQVEKQIEAILNQSVR